MTSVLSMASFFKKQRVATLATLIFGTLTASLVFQTAHSYRVPLPSAHLPHQNRNVHPHSNSLSTTPEDSFDDILTERAVAFGASSLTASTMRHLTDSQSTPLGKASAEHGRRRHVSKKRQLVIVLTSTTAFILVIAIFLFLWWAIRARKLRNSVSRMKIWRNQLSTMHQSHYDDSEFAASDSCRSGRFEATKNRPRPSALRDAMRCASPSPCSLAYVLLQAATNNFSSSNLLGEGSFGLVYRARLDDDTYVAVKRFTGAGQTSRKELLGEVELMSKLRHPNLVALLGYSRDGPEPLVVHELMQNGSLHDQLHGPSCGKALTWSLRLKIALEAARVGHLHESCKPAIIHRDFKSSNILLDASFNAKVSDFGSAVAVEDNGVLKGEILVQGTFGYIAPEYLLEGKLTEKSDVYGFGVVLLELLTGRLPIDTSLPLGSQSLVTWVTPMVVTNRAMLIECLDPSLQGTVNKKHLHQVAATAVLCVQSEPCYRPLITDVVQSLLPLVPQELGGAMRDPKARRCNVSTSEVISKMVVVAVPAEQSGFAEAQQLNAVYSVRTDYSILSESVERCASLPKSSSSLISGPSADLGRGKTTP